MADLRQNQRDLCLYCDQPVVYGWWEFWKDTGDLIPKGPEAPYIPWGKEPTEKQRAEKQAAENWEKARKERGVEKGYWRIWVHIVNWPITKASDIQRHCGTERHRRPATPSSICSERLRVGGTCNKKAKETITDNWGAKKALCGIHLSHLRRAVKEAEEADQARELSAWREEEVAGKIARLEALGLTNVKEEWVRHYIGKLLGSYTGKVVVDPDELLLLLEEHVEAF